MSREKLNGSQIHNIKRWNESKLIINLRSGEQLLLYSVPTDYGYSSEIKIKKLEEKWL
ncbi:hypothetical protein D3C87_1043110 [compost metagenome]